MLMVNPTHGLRGPSFLNGLNGNANIETLQRALTNLAISSGRPAINPGPITGDLNDSTMVAISAAHGLITEELPSWMYLALQAAMMVGATNSTAKSYVAQYAPQLTIAVNTAAVKFKQQAPSSNTATLYMPDGGLPGAQPVGVFASLFPIDWYKRPTWGLALVLIGAFGFYKYFLAAPKK